MEILIVQLFKVCLQHTKQCLYTLKALNHLFVERLSDVATALDSCLALRGFIQTLLFPSALPSPFLQSCLCVSPWNL